MSVAAKYHHGYVTEYSWITKNIKETFNDQLRFSAALQDDPGFEPWLCSYLLIVCREWVDGEFSQIDPDTVEQDVGNYWRELYKLEKTFAKNPNAKTIAKKVKFSTFFTAKVKASVLKILNHFD